MPESCITDDDSDPKLLSEKILDFMENKQKYLDLAQKQSAWVRVERHHDKWEENLFSVLGEKEIPQTIMFVLPTWVNFSIFLAFLAVLVAIFQQFS